MKEIICSEMLTQIRNYPNSVYDGAIDGIVVTTNGIVKANGEAVMGKGIALQMNNLFKLSGILGNYLNMFGNRAFYLGQTTYNGIPLRIFTFPTKHNWKDNSDITLITKSIQELNELVIKFPCNNIYLPEVSCGCGHLNYNVAVKPWLESMFDDKFIVCRKQRGI